MLEPNPNYNQDLLSEADQLKFLGELHKLFENPWFKHLIATWTQELERTRSALYILPLDGLATTIAMIQTRGEATAYNAVIREPYDRYNDLIEEIKENERARDEL